MAKSIGAYKRHESLSTDAKHQAQSCRNEKANVSGGKTPISASVKVPPKGPLQFDIPQAEELVRALSSDLYWRDFPIFTALWLWKLSFLDDQGHGVLPGWGRVHGDRLGLPAWHRHLFRRLAWIYGLMGSGLSNLAIYVYELPDGTKDAVSLDTTAGDGYTRTALESTFREVLEAHKEYSTIDHKTNQREFSEANARFGKAVAIAYWFVRGFCFDTFFSSLHDAMISDTRDLQATALQRVKNCFLPAYDRSPRFIRTREERARDEAVDLELGLKKRTKRHKVAPTEDDPTAVIAGWLFEKAQIDGEGPYALQYRGLPIFNYMALREEFQRLLKLNSKERSQLRFMRTEDWKQIDKTHEKLNEERFLKWIGELYPGPSLKTTSAWRTSDAEKLDHSARKKSPATSGSNKRDKP